MPRPKKKAPNRSDSRYEYKMTIGRDMHGKAIRKSFYSLISIEDAKEQAKQWEIESKAAELSDAPIISNHMTFSEWAAVWLKTYKKPYVRANTYSGNYEIPSRVHLTPYFGKMMLEDIKPANVQAFFTKKKSEGCSLEGLSKMRICLHSIFETAIENDLCRKNPVTRNISISSNQQPTEKRAYSPEQSQTVIDFAKEHKNGLAIWLILETGISRSELLGLKWDDIDFENKMIAIVRGVTDSKNADTGKMEVVVGEPKNDFRKRLIPINDDICAALQSKYDKRTMKVNGSRRKKVEPITITANFVFCNAKGQPMSPNNWSKRSYKLFMEDLQKAHPDIPFLHPHELRHTFATIRRNNGADIFALGKLMGHADLNMLYKKYAKVDIESLRDAASCDKPKLTTN